MAFCSSCGGQVPAGAAVCPACGHSAAAPAAGAAPATTASNDNLMGALAYVTLIPPIIFLVMEPYNKNRFIRFHAFQSLFLHAAGFIGWIALFMIALVLSVVPILGHLIAFLLWMVLAFGLIIVWVILLIKANQGLMYKLPVIGDMAEKQANV